MERCFCIPTKHEHASIRANSRPARLQLEASDSNGRTPLHYACYHATAEVVSELCRLRADVNHVDAKGRTPLHVVVCRQHIGALPS